MCFRPMRYGQTNATRRQQGGYVLVIMLVIIVTGSLYGLLDRLNVNAAETSRVTATNNSLKQAREALLAYAATYPDRHSSAGFGYLPCPDMKSDDPLGMIGTEAGSVTCQTSIAIGLLPYRTLGLPELRDGDGNCLWYAVSNTHKSFPKYSPTLSDTTVAQYRITDGTGNVLAPNPSTPFNDADPDSTRGVAAVIIAPGPPISGQTRSAVDNKPCTTDSGQLSAYLESYGPTFINGKQQSSDGVTLKNDTLSWITAKDTFELAKMRKDYDKKTTSPCDAADDGCDGDD